MYKMTITFKGHPSTTALESLARVLRQWVPQDADELADDASREVITSYPPGRPYVYRLEYVEGEGT